MADRTLIQKYATGIIKALVEQARAIGDLSHPTTKGTLRELFVTTVLERFLTSQFGITSGVVVNQAGEQSSQADIIIYDTRILPPFIREESVGVVPIEAVIAVIEVKSGLTYEKIRKAERDAVRLRDIAKASSVRSELQPPGFAVVGLMDDGVGDLQELEAGRKWLEENLTVVKWVCLVDAFSWIHLDGWKFQPRTDEMEETKRFIAVLLDNIRTHAERNYQRLAGLEETGLFRHQDWLSAYIRERRDSPTCLRQ